MMFITQIIAILISMGMVSAANVKSRANVTNAQLMPAPGARNVNPDMQLSISFSSPPTIGSNGTIRVFDAVTNGQVDIIDISIPSSPSPYGNGSTKANYSDTSTLR